jgi:hypothetical protein
LRRKRKPGGAAGGICPGRPKGGAVGGAVGVQGKPVGLGLSPWAAPGIGGVVGSFQNRRFWKDRSESGAPQSPVFWAEPKKGARKILCPVKNVFIDISP